MEEKLRFLLLFLYFYVLFEMQAALENKGTCNRAAEERTKIGLQRDEESAIIRWTLAVFKLVQSNVNKKDLQEWGVISITIGHV